MSALVDAYSKVFLEAKINFSAIASSAQANRFVANFIAPLRLTPEGEILQCRPERAESSNRVNSGGRI